MQCLLHATAQARLLGTASSRDTPGALLDDPNAYVNFSCQTTCGCGNSRFRGWPEHILANTRSGSGWITLSRLAKMNWRDDYGSICVVTIPLWSASQVRLKDMRFVRRPRIDPQQIRFFGSMVGRGGALMAVRCGFRRLRFAAASINLLGLILSLGTWGVEVWLRAHPLPVLFPINLTRTLGVFCWLLGLLMFIVVWIAEGIASKK